MLAEFVPLIGGRYVFIGWRAVALVLKFTIGVRFFLRRLKLKRCVDRICFAPAVARFNIRLIECLLDRMLARSNICLMEKITYTFSIL